MPLLNVMLTSYSKGYIEEINPASAVSWDRRESFLQAGDIEIAEAKRVAQAQLDIYGDPRRTIQLGIESVDTTGSQAPSEPHTPYHGHKVGDIITAPNEAGTPTAYRIVASTVQMDDMGNPRTVHTLESQPDIFEKLNRKTLQQLQNGNLGGRVQGSPQPDRLSLIPTGRLPDVNVPPFSTIDVAALFLESAPWKAQEFIRLTWVQITALEAGSGTTTFSLRKNGVEFQAESLGPGETEEFQLITGQFFSPVDELNIGVIAAGGHSKVTVQVDATTSDLGVTAS